MASKTAAPAIDIITAIRDPRLINDVLSPAQEAALRSIYGLPLPPDQVAIVEECTGRPPQVGTEFRETALVVGRRGGKSDKVCANVAVYESLLRPHKLSPGETGVVLLLAQNMRQAQVVANYVKGKLEGSPILSQHVRASRALEVDLNNGISIQVHPCSFRAIRGMSVVTCICDEIGFWRDEDSSNPDVEVIRAVRPAMATFPGAKLILASSPYSKSGALWDWYQRRHEDTSVLVWHASTLSMNPSVDRAFLEREERREPETFRREYLAEFVDSISAYLPSDAIEACTIRGRLSMSYSDRFAYCCAIDAAFKGDRFTLGIAHFDSGIGKVVIDRVEAWEGSRQAPLSLAQVLPSIKAIAAQYRLHRVVADQFAIEPLRHAFAQIGLTLEEQTFSTPFKADMYSSLRSLLTDGRIELLDHPQSLKELRSLEVEALPGGGSRIGHPRRAHASDDFADVIALSALEAVRGNGSRPFDIDSIVVGGPSIWAGDPLGASGDDDYGLRPGEQIVGQMNDRGGFDKVGGW